MSQKYKGILTAGHLIDEEFSVMFFLKKGSYAETYRVKDLDGKIKILKLFNYSKLHRTQFDANGDILEINIVKNIKHPNIIKYVKEGNTLINGQKFAYVIFDFISGETLADRMKREQTFNPYDAKDIIVGVLNGLSYLHNLENPIVHNEITNLNIMLDLSGKMSIPKIIDFGYARYLSQSNKDFLKEGLNPFYLANETFNKVFSIQSDLFSVGALYYHLLFGLPPWFVEISTYKSDKIKLEEVILEERKKPLKILDTGTKIDQITLSIINKALQVNVDDRFKDAKEFIHALNDDIEIRSSSLSTEGKKPIKKEVKKGKGFAAIAGMKELKDKMKYDVIDVIENPEEYLKHNLGLPNGMLLYGPPGCGKTFFAERFSEEAGYNYIKVISSDIASIYVHGAQEKIGKLFKDARAQAPTILYFDELDAMVPNREKLNTQSQSGEVNEFLSQLDNIGDSGVFVIGSTNKPDLIDKAVLRAGRLEKWFYIPPPDFDARNAMFKLYLKKRPIDLGIDYRKLATLTEFYVSSDIKFLIDEASRKTIRDNENRISMKTLEFIIGHQKPTVSLAELKKYEVIRRKIEEDKEENNINERTRIGF